MARRRTPTPTPTTVAEMEATAEWLENRGYGNGAAAFRREAARLDRRLRAIDAAARAAAAARDTD